MELGKIMRHQSDSSSFLLAVRGLDFHRARSIYAKGEVDVNYVDSQGISPIVEAIQKNSINMVEYLLSLKADVTLLDKAKRSLLHHAAKVGNPLIIKKLLSIHDFDLSGVDYSSFTPLHYAIYEYHIDAVAYLCSKGADVNVVDAHSNTPLHIAVALGDYKIVHALLYFKADPSIVDKKMRTPEERARDLEDVVARVRVLKVFDLWRNKITS